MAEWIGESTQDFLQWFEPTTDLKNSVLKGAFFYFY